MASFPQYLRPTPLSLDTSSRRDFEGDDGGVLGEPVLETPLESNEIFPDFTDADAATTATNRSSAPSSSTFYKSPPYPPSYAVSSWASGSCTPTTVYDGFSTESYDGDASAAYLSGTPTTASSAGFELFPPNQAMTLSNFPTPASGNAPMPSPTADRPEVRALPKNVRGSSPLRANSSMVRRGDGIRKKNARFDIPAERNLHNIDHFIAQSSDDQEIKELKQQKRLLRNRQAALDSRQRKKQHTERLEEEKKTYTGIIAELEERVAELELRQREHLQLEEDWKAAQQQYDHFIDVLRLEKEEMIRSHTLETGDLRKKNAFLTEHVQKMESTAMSTVASSSGFSADLSEVDGLAMDGPGWDNFLFPQDLPTEPEAKPQQSLVFPIRKLEKQAEDADKPAASGLLLILLLCGAFVASKSSTTSSPSIPRMPDEIVAASATVLDTLFKDAGVHGNEGRLEQMNQVRMHEPGPSAGAWPMSKMQAEAGGMVGLSDDSLDVLNEQLVQPSKEQEREQVFSLTAQQYKEVTSQDFLGPEPSVISPTRPDLGPTLAAVRERHKASAAEVYTRSLMWDRVPADVVREFARFVAANNPDRPEGA